MAATMATPTSWHGRAWSRLRPWLALRRAGLVAAAVLAVAFGVLGGISDLLGQMHLDGQPSGRVPDMWFRLDAPDAPKPDRPREVICGWQAFEIAISGGAPSSSCADSEAMRVVGAATAERDQPASCTNQNYLEGCAVANARSLAIVYLVWDIVAFCPAYTLVLISLWLRARNESQARTSRKGVRPALRAFGRSRFVLLAIGVAFLADQVENVLTLRLVDHTWSDGSLLIPLPDDWVPHAIWIAGVVKWAFIVVALVPFLFSALLWLAESRKVAFRLVPVTALGLIPFVALQHPQGTDVVRGWDGGDLVVAVGLTVALCAAVAALTYKIANGVRQAEELHLKGKPGRGWVMLGVGVGCSSLGLLVANGVPSLPWPGVGALLLMIGLVFVLSAPLELWAVRNPDSNAEEGRERPREAASSVSNPATVAAVLGVVPLAAVFVPAVDATAGAAFYFRFSGLDSWLDAEPGRSFLWACIVLAVGIPVVAGAILHVGEGGRGLGRMLHDAWQHELGRRELFAQPLTVAGGLASSW
jgi:hypothetical protein